MNIVLVGLALGLGFMRNYQMFQYVGMCAGKTDIIFSCSVNAPAPFRVAVFGPTGSGVTTVCTAVSQALGCEVVQWTAEADISEAVGASSGYVLDCGHKTTEQVCIVSGDGVRGVLMLVLVA